MYELRTLDGHILLSAEYDEEDVVNDALDSWWQLGDKEWDAIVVDSDGRLRATLQSRQVTYDGSGKACRGFVLVTWHGGGMTTYRVTKRPDGHLVAQA